MKIKRLLVTLLTLTFIFIVPICASAEEYTAPNGYSYDYMVPNLDAKMADAHKYEYVYDFADLLTDEEEQDLSSAAEEQSKTYGIAINFLTYDDAYYKSEVTFTDDFYDYYITKLDFYNEVDGVLFAIDMDNRQVYINTVGTAIANISDEEIDDILDATYGFASNAEYYNFFVSTLDKTLYAYSEETYTPYYYDGYGEIDNSPSILSAIMPTGASLIASLIVTALVIVILFSIHNKMNKAPAASTYLDGFKVNSRNAVFMGHREEVIVDFYKQSSSSSGGGGSSHSSGGGGSHGGGGHGF